MRAQPRARRTEVGAERKAAMPASLPLHRLGAPQDIAEAIVFLGSDKARFLTGQIIGIDGGRTAT